MLNILLGILKVIGILLLLMLSLILLVILLVLLGPICYGASGRWKEKKDLINNILVGNFLSMSKGAPWRVLRQRKGSRRERGQCGLFRKHIRHRHCCIRRILTR